MMIKIYFIYEIKHPAISQDRPIDDFYLFIAYNKHYLE